MPVTNYNAKIESTYESGTPLNSEYYTYYPTWFNTPTTTPSVTPSKTTPYGSIIDEIQTPSSGFTRPIEDVVIAGISGRFPESDNVEEFAYNLYNGVDMVTEQERRWPNGLYGLPKRNGTLKDITRFDAQFFGINPKQVDNMDPQLRLLLEVAYEALFDSGFNPTELRGTRTGVFIGASSSEALHAFSTNPEELSGYSMTGCATSMLANRLSFFFDFKGPSYTIDTACSSSLVALDAAINAIRTGQCDYAIVGGVNLLARPQTSLQFQKLGMLSQEGKCKSFDADGKGYVRSETIGAIFLQKKSTCRRFYAKILHAKVNTDGAKDQGITFPSGEVQARLLKEIYAEANIDPALVTYVEAHGTGTKAGDPQELNSIAEIFASPRLQRTIPLFIGSTKSNMGHPEPASGIAALVKMLISIQRGVIPANLHFKEPNQDVPALLDGRIRVVNKNTQFRGGLMALNSFGFGGANAHVLLQPNNELILNRMGSGSFWNQDLSEIASAPRLFQFCARSEEALEHVFDNIERTPSDLAAHVLLQPISSSPPVTHPYRGFTIINGKQPVREIQQVSMPEKRPIWYVFSGMGTQWQGMGQELMKLDVFRQSIIKSAEYLRPYGLNLMDIIYGKHNAYERTLNAFVGIAAIQIALVDVLRAVGVEPDGILGHSVGELGCAYADNCFSAEETLLAAYYRGKCIEEAQLPLGAMAAVGLTWEECQRRCPTGVVPACHNSRDTVTISGPKIPVMEFIQQLKSEGIFAKEVDSSNVAFHSYYMTSIAPSLKSSLEKIIRSPKQRSSKWISTSIPEQRWDSDLARFSSPDYHVNNLCSPVLFQEALKCIPANAITIEIAPHALLQAILKRSLSAQTVFIPLMKKDATNQVEFVLTQLGRLYVEGANIDTTKLFIPAAFERKVYPVPYNTRFLSPLVKWDHSQQWNIPKYEDFILGAKGADSFANNTFKYTVDAANVVEDAYLAGHQIDGRVLYPATGYLYLVWKSLAKMNNFTQVEQIPVAFENVEIHRATILNVKDQQSGKKISFTVTIMPTNGLFELTEGGNVVVTGRVYVPETPFDLQTPDMQTSLSSRQRTDLMEQEEIYKELRLRGYEYNGEFQPIVKADIDGTRGELLWNGKWIPFLDAMLQMNVLGQRRGLLLPTRIRSIRIDPMLHTEYQKYARFDEMNPSKFMSRFIKSSFTDEKPASWYVIPVVFDPFTNTTMSGGVEIVGLHATSAPRRQFYQPTILERVNFVPYVERQLDDEYVFVDKLAGTKADDIDAIHVDPDFGAHETTIRQYREFYEYYLNELKRCAVQIMRKIEFPMGAYAIISPTPLPFTIQKQLEELSIRMPTIKSKYQTTPATPFAELIEGGKLLKFLSYLANLDSTDSQYFYNVQKSFSDKFAYYLAIEEDRVLNYFNKRSYYLKNVLDTVLENTQFTDYKQPTLKVLEISPSFSHFFGGKVNSFIKTHPHVSAVDYQYMPVFGSEYSMPEGLEFLSYFNKQFANPIEKVEWNMGLRSGKLTAEPPRHLKDFDLVIFNGSLNTLLPYVDSEFNLQTWLHTIVDKVMKPQGFMLVHEYINNFDALTQLNQLEQVVFRQQQPSQMIYPIQKFQNESQWRQCIEDAGFYPVALKSDGILSTMSLYRRPYNTTIKPSTLYEEKILIDDLDQFNWIEKLKLALADKQLERVWLVSEKSPNSGIVGLVNCLRKEFGGEKIRCVFITDRYPIMHTSYLLPVVQEKMSQPGVAQWTQLFDQIRKTDLVMNVFRNGKWGSYRHIFEGSNVDSIVIDNEKAFYEAMKYDSQAKFGNAYINLLSRGDLSTLKWMQSPEPFINDVTRQLACQVSYAALNFRDIMLATGKLTPEAIPNYYKMQDSLLGMEFCGYDKNNRQKRYMGMVPAKGLATTVVVDPKYVWEVPRDWTLEQAATVPVAYSTAYYALIVRGNLRKGERVLIHAGSGAVGQAAVAIALSYGCKVFVTVSSDEKRDYLKAVFPGQLTDDSFANSRDIQFEKQIMKATQGRGVDVVLNSLAEDKLQASIRVLAQHGRFLEIGKFDLNKNSQLGLSVFLKNIAFHGILLDSLFDADNAEWKQVYQFVEEGIRAGVVRPLKSTVFNVDEIEEAFRFMAQGKHIGKVLVKVWDPKETNEQPIQITGLPKVWFSPMQTYIITGGLGGFGLELAQWMVERGARRLILTSRSGVRTGYQTRKLRTLLEEFNAQVQVVPFDVKDEAECIALIKEAQKMSFDKKIGGIFHLAAVLEDGMFENQTAERFRRVNDVKYQGALNLDKFTRIEGVMDDSAYFVVFSSVTSGRGNFGQTNYGFANSGMERICEFRRRDGKHALAIQWGAIGDVGLIVESNFGGDNDTVVGGTVPQRISSCLKTLEHLLLKSTEPRDSAIWSTFVPAERMLSTGGFKSTPSQQQKSLIEMVANVLGLKDVKQWRNEQMTLGEMGLDSLMSVEIKQILEQCFNLPLSTKEIQQLTMEKLKLIEQSKTSPIAESLKIVDVPTTIINSKVHYLMPTRVIEKLNQIEFTSPQQIPVFVIHPIEGHVNMLKSWAKHMKYPVYGVQYTQEAMQFETIEQLADFYFQNIDKELAKYTTVVQPRIHLCGYSFGASVAFEMAGRRTNRIASLTLLDGSHSYVTAHVNMYKSKFQLENTIETEAEALFSFVQQYTQVLSRRDFIEDLLKLATFEQRVKYAVRELMNKSQFQFEAIDLEQAARSYVAKLFMSHKYQPKQMVRLNEILLIKSGQRSNLVQTLGEDYGLSTVFNGKIDVQVVDGDHRSFLDANNGFQVASIMNEYLLRCF